MKIRLVEYDPEWPVMFARERELLRSVLGEAVVQIEHIGSTSVEGLVSKPIIDILIGLRDFGEADGLVKRIVGLGYVYYPQYEEVMPDRRFFKKMEGEAATHHIHMVEVGGTFWERHLRFRDYLRGHPDTREEYAMLKRELAKRDWVDTNDFAKAKTEFIQGVERQAVRQGAQI